jgi:hypothetical protein
MKLTPDEGRQRLVQLGQLAHQDVRGFGVFRNLNRGRGSMLYFWTYLSPPKKNKFDKKVT